MLESILARSEFCSLLAARHPSGRRVGRASFGQRGHDVREHHRHEGHVTIESTGTVRGRWLRTSD
jgi:hypothetical protein